MKAVFAFVFCFAAAFAQADPKICSDLQKATRGGRTSERLTRFLKVQWDFQMHDFPEWATFVGYPGQNDRWTDLSAEALERRKTQNHCELQILRKIGHSGLSETERVTWELAIRDLELAIEGEVFPLEDLVLDHMGGLHSQLPDLIFSAPKANLKDLQDLLTRLSKIPEVVEQHERLLRKGLQDHVTPVQMFLQKVPAQFDQILTARIEDSPLYKPFLELPALSPADQAQVQAQAQKVLAERVFPALKKFKVFVVETYIPQARTDISWSKVPNGENWYRYNVKTQTTTSKTPEELHQLGLREVERIHGEMQKIRDELKFKGTAQEFNKSLMTSSKFYYTDREQLLIGYRDLAKRIDEKLPTLFQVLPRNPYGVREIPDFKAGQSPAAYYEPGSLKAGRAGYFEANTSDLKARPKWGMEALTLHEAVPGHHLQISLAQEIEGLPEFRKHAGPTAFVEGWALYAESLGTRLGFYKDPYSRYGALAYELWRAVRLVVDTGMHAKGWSRDEALQYFMNELPKAQSESEVEIDRYITWPGQALAYKVGQLKFLELREEAEKKLGSKFDIRVFHEQVLKNGALPLDVLEKSFRLWLSQQKAPE